MKRILSVFIFLITISSFAQQNQPWRSFFSYNHIIDISQSSSRIFAAGESSIFSKNIVSGELKTVTSVDGLKTENVSAIYYSPGSNLTLVGNENGLLQIVREDNTVLNVIDIIEETTIPANQKKINHIFEYNGRAYLSCDFGIAVYNLQTFQFGDTYYIGPNGDEIKINQSTVYDGFIYAATAENGIKRGSLSSGNLIDFNQWEEVQPGQWVGITSFGSNLIAADASGMVYRYLNGAFSFFSQQTSVVDLRDSGTYLTISTPQKVSVYDTQLMLVQQIDVDGQGYNITCATVISNKVYIGTLMGGLYTVFITNPSAKEWLTPDGPTRNSIFSLQKTANNLWAVYGGYNYFHTPNYQMYGVSRFTANGWENIPYFSVLNALSLSDIGVSPTNENDIYVSSYQSGLLHIVDDVAVTLYDNTNTGSNGLQSLVDPNSPSFTSVRINGPNYDANGAIWMTNASVERPLKRFRPGSNDWVSYSFEDVITSPQTEYYEKLIIDRNGTKWIPSVNSGLIAFNETMNNKFIVIGEEHGLPDTYVKSLAIDNNNQLWIGTVRGLRILSSVDRFVNENELEVNAIIIMEDELAQELMFEQVITDIVVDGANNKWIATAQSGAFLVSPNGQRTLAHFTKQNSPLPSNVINDIELDRVTGEVFFATDKGMVSYKGNSTEAQDDLNNVFVFPNPVRPGFEGNVNISGLMDNVNLKITDIEGNLVYETTSEGGTVLWDTTAFGRYKVASGVYMIFIASEDGTQTKVKKVMIVR